MPEPAEEQKTHGERIRELVRYPEPVQKKLLQEMYEGSDTIQKEGEEIADVPALVSYWDKYRLLGESEDFLFRLKKAAEGLYENGSREERQSISVVMKNACLKEWEEYLKGRLREQETLFDFVNFLNAEMGKIEPGFVGMYAARLWELSDTAVTDADQRSLENAFIKLAQTFGNYLGQEVRAEFFGLFHCWEADRERRKLFQHLKNGDVENYFETLVCAVSRRYLKDRRKEVPGEREELYEEYREILQKFPDFSRRVKNWKRGEAGRLTPEAEEKIEDMQSFFLAADFKVSRETLEDAGRLLSRAMDRLGDGPEEVKRLRRQVYREMERLREDYDREVRRASESGMGEAGTAKELASLYNRVARDSIRDGRKPLRRFYTKSSVREQYAGRRRGLAEEGNVRGSGGGE